MLSDGVEMEVMQLSRLPIIPFHWCQAAMQQRTYHLQPVLKTLTSLAGCSGLLDQRRCEQDSRLGAWQAYQRKTGQIIENVEFAGPVQQYSVVAARVTK